MVPEREDYHHQEWVKCIRKYRQRSVLRFVVIFILSLGQIMLGGLLIQGFVIKALISHASKSFEVDPSFVPDDSNYT